LTHEPTVQRGTNQTPQSVFILGAGFTRAFNPSAPLNEDNGIANKLVDRFMSFPHAARLLDEEQSRHSGSVNIEQLATRLYDGMPYDKQLEATEQFRLLRRCPRMVKVITPPYSLSLLDDAG